MNAPGTSAIAIALATLLASGCAHVPRATQDGHLPNIWSQISDKSYIRVRGVGMPGFSTRGQTARRAQSREAALVAARYQLLALVKGVRLEGGISVSQAMLRSSLIRELANDVVKGGNEVLTEWMPDDGCVVTLELKRSTVEHLIQRDTPKECALEAEVARLNKQVESMKTPLGEKIEHAIFDIVVFPPIFAVMIPGMLSNIIFKTNFWSSDDGASNTSTGLAGQPDVANMSSEDLEHLHR